MSRTGEGIDATTEGGEVAQSVQGSFLVDALRLISERHRQAREDQKAAEVRIRKCQFGLMEALMAASITGEELPLKFVYDAIFDRRRDGIWIERLDAVPSSSGPGFYGVDGQRPRWPNFVLLRPTGVDNTRYAVHVDTITVLGLEETVALQAGGAQEQATPSLTAQEQNT